MRCSISLSLSLQLPLLLLQYTHLIYNFFWSSNSLSLSPTTTTTTTTTTATHTIHTPHIQLSLSLSLSPPHLTTSCKLFLKTPSSFSEGKPMATILGLMSAQTKQSFLNPNPTSTLTHYRVYTSKTEINSNKLVFRLQNDIQYPRLTYQPY